MKGMMERKEKISSNFIRNEKIFRVLLCSSQSPSRESLQVGVFPFPFLFSTKNISWNLLKWLTHSVCKFQVITSSRNCSKTELKNRVEGVEKIQTFLYCVVCRKRERGKREQEERKQKRKEIRRQPEIIMGNLMMDW